MLDRSSLLRAVGVPAALACALLVPPTAPAAQRPVAVPASAPVVAGPTADGVRVRGFVRGEQLCLAVEFADPSSRDTWTADLGGARCEHVPVLAAFDQGSAWTASTPYGDAPYAEVGVAGPEVAAVETRRRGRTLARSQTRPTPLPGPAADVRVYLLTHRAGSRTPAPDELAFLDAAGAVRRAYDGGPFEGEYAVPHSARRVVARGGHGAARWTLASWIARPLAPTPLEPERRAPIACLGFTSGTEGQDATCGEEAAASGSLAPLIDRSPCAAAGLVVGALARPPARRIVAVLGDGSRRSFALHEVPGAPAGERAGALALGPGVALRRLVAVGAGGRVSDEAELDVPPVMRVGCDDDGSGSSVFSAYSPGDPADGHGPLGAGPHTPIVEDDGVRICLAVDRRPRHPQDCSVPDVEVHASFLDRRRAADGTYFVGLVPAEVAAARLELDDGTTLEAPASPIPGYQGRYAEVLRLVAVEVPRRRKVFRASLVDARGRTLSAFGAVTDQPAAEHVTPLLHTPGLPTLTAAQLPKTSGVGPYPCVTLGPRSAGCTFASPDMLTLKALCTPRRIVLYGLVARSDDRISVRLADGREVRGRTAPMPAAIAPGAGVVLVVLGPHDAPRELVVRGRAPYRQDLVLPPAADQCGYSDWLWRGGL